MSILIELFEFYDMGYRTEDSLYLFKNRHSILNSESDSYYPCVYVKSESLFIVGHEDIKEDMKEFNNLHDAMVYYILRYT